MLEQRARFRPAARPVDLRRQPDDIVAGRVRSRPAGDPRVDRARTSTSPATSPASTRPTSADREALRAALGYRPDERLCVVTVGGSGVGDALLRRVLDAVPLARRLVPELRFVVVAGPRIDPASLPRPRRRRGARLRARPAPPPRRLRRRRRAGRADHLHGADRGRAAVRLRAAAPPLRAELPRPRTGWSATAPARCLDYDEPRRPGRPGRRDRRRARPRRWTTAPVETDGAARAARLLADLL